MRASASRRRRSPHRNRASGSPCADDGAAQGHELAAYAPTLLEAEPAYLAALCARAEALAIAVAPIEGRLQDSGIVRTWPMPMKRSRVFTRHAITSENTWPNTTSQSAGCTERVSSSVGSRASFLISTAVIA